MAFRKNFHIAKPCSLKAINHKITNYHKDYSPPKYLIFIREMLRAKWEVRLYEAKVSKYVFLKRGKELYKVRFSNHPPLYHKEMSNDCDYYVGVSNKTVHTTEQIINIFNLK